MEEKTHIFKSGIRILRPAEWQLLINAIPKFEYQTKLEALLYTGARYNELKWLFNNPKRFDGKYILMDSQKAKAKHKQRYIRLNENGRLAVTYFLRQENNLPNHNSWIKNLKRWADIANLDSTGLSCKSTRKTWESWLATMYPDNWNHIFLSQGHTDRVSLEFYMMCPFDEDDEEEMKFYTKRWLKKKTEEST